MFDKNDPQFLWVSPDFSGAGDGSFDQPFSTIEIALKKAEPGNTIILKNGIYRDDVTVQVSGTIDKPIKITVEENATAEVVEGCWFLYDTSDMIISGLSFRDAPCGAISVIGACQRNRFENLNFVNCGSAEKSSCTMYIGGSGAECNVVENCTFKYDFKRNNSKSSAAHVALMISEGDTENGNVIKHHIVRKNQFENYTHAVLIGSNDSNGHMHSHIIEYNTITDCSSDGIVVKCGDTQIRGNLIKSCSQNAIKIAAGSCSTIEDNRIESCSNGIAVNGAGHTVSNNCIFNCSNHAILVCGNNGNESIAAINLFIENNTCVNCGTSPDKGKDKVSGILVDAGTTCIISRNLVHGEGSPYQIALPKKPECGYSQKETDSHFVITENAVSGSANAPDGFSLINAEFPFCAEGNYENNSGYGAQGWMLRPEGFNPEIDSISADSDYLHPSSHDDEEDDDQEDINTSVPYDKQELISSLFSEINEEESPNYYTDEQWAD